MSPIFLSYQMSAAFEHPHSARDWEVAANGSPELSAAVIAGARQMSWINCRADEARVETVQPHQVFS